MPSRAESTRLSLRGSQQRDIKQWGCHEGRRGRPRKIQRLVEALDSLKARGRAVFPPEGKLFCIKQPTVNICSLRQLARAKVRWLFEPLEKAET